MGQGRQGRVWKRGGVWWIQYSVAGRQYRESAKTSRKVQAEALLAKRQQELWNGTFFPQRKQLEQLTLESLRTLWADERSGKRSIEHDRARLDATAEHFGKHTLISTLDAEQVSAWRDALRKTPGKRPGTMMAEATVNRHLAVLRSALNLAGKRGHAHRDPFAGVTLEKERNRRNRICSPEEYQRLRDAAAGELRLLIVIGYWIGMRQGEVHLRQECVPGVGEGGSRGRLTALAVFQGVRPPVIEEHEVVVAGLPAALDGTVLVALSDLHIGSQLDGRWLEARVRQVQAQQPDVVVLVGDILEGRGRHDDEIAQALRGLSARLGVWAVAGNHERHGRGGTAVRVLEEAGITLLDSRAVELRPGFVLAGVEDLTAYRRGGGRGRPLAATLAGRPAGATVLLSHTPELLEEAAAAGVALTLCGHTHGGQLWPFGYLVRWRYPYLAGRYDIGGMTAIVSRGAGTWGPRMRLWPPGEILRVVLHAPTGERGEGA